MLLLMFIGLFTSRVVLGALGVEDFGVYNVVGGVVTVFTFITTSISSAISRYIAYELGSGTAERLKKVFSTGVVIQIAFAMLMVLLVETAGLWWVNHRLVLPEGRLAAANVVLQCSLGVLVINLLAVPYNATIIAHEKMSAFAFISIGEAVLKLVVALLLYVSVFDKLETYAVLMLAVALLVRIAYGVYCGKHFAESRGRLSFDGALMKEMTAFAGWSFFGSSAYVFNTQGVNQVANVFFGVVVNAARGIASQVETIVKQFVSNFLTALNPQITKSWASDDRGYCFELVRKGAKYSYLVILIFLLPFLFEADKILDIWLGAAHVPEHSADFVRLILVAMLVDLYGNPLLTLVQATGKVRRYYLVTGLSSYLGLPIVWLMFKAGAAPQMAYVVFIAVYLVVLAQKLLIVRRQTGFPVGDFLHLTLRLLTVTALSIAAPLLLWLSLPSGWGRLILVCIASWLGMAIFAYLLVLTQGEKAYLFRKFANLLPDRLFLKQKYGFAMGRPLDLRHPRRFTEQIQWLKLHDRKPLYHKLADKAEVKNYVEDQIGKAYVIPTLGVWDGTSQIDWASLPRQFVLKCTHDSGSTIVCTDKATFDRDAACAKLDAALKVDFYKRDREWVYKGIKPRIIAESYLCENVSDYKFFCFDGKPEFMFIATNRGKEGEETKFDFFDMAFRHIDVRNGHPNAAVAPSEPFCFAEMKRLAAELSRGIPQVRIDFYEVDGQVFFGEYTFYHWGGFVPFDPDSADFSFGQYLQL